MKQSLLITAIMLLLSATASFSQFGGASKTPNDTLKSTRVLPNGNVILSIYAPEARTVSVAGDVIPWGIKVQGIKADLDCRTKVPGLFVGGRVRSIDPGVTMGSWSIASATVLGYRAGENAARFAQGHQSLGIDEAEVNLAKTKLYAPLGEVEMDPEAILQRIQKILFSTSVLILKNEKALKAALDQIFSIQEEMIPQMRARDVHELVELKQVENMVLIAELMLKASLMRTESRGSHYREDYPRLDNENWMKWILVSQENGDINLRTEPLPLDKYRFKPTRYYSDNFMIPEE